MSINDICCGDDNNSNSITRKSSSTKMFGWDGILVTFVLFFTLFCDRTSSQCTQLTPCSCMFPNGQGYTLTELGKLSPLNVSTSNYTFYFHPCTNVRLVNGSECYNGNGVSLCAKDNNKTVSLGTAEETVIEVGPDSSKEPVLKLSHERRVTTIGLSCCSLCSASKLLVDSIGNNEEYHLVVVSPYACQVFMHEKGLSTGSILVILLFVCSGIYFIGGAIVLKLTRGGTGWEMVPNHQFWRELPVYVRDGIAFTFNCCRADGYDRI